MNHSYGVGAVLLAATLGQTGASHAFTFDDIDYWVGDGEQRAALVIDWNDGKASESYAWGFRWDGQATGEDLLRAIAGSGIVREAQGGDVLSDMTGADTRLHVRLSDWVWGLTLFGLGYDADGDGGSFIYGYEDPALVGEAGSVSDPDDHYDAGWFSGFWSYYTADAGSPYAGGSGWTFSNLGMTDRELVDGSWDGWSYTDFGDRGGEPGGPVAATVPEPGVWVVVLGAVGIGFLSRKRRLRTVGLMVVLAGGAASVEASPFATRVVSWTPGTTDVSSSFQSDPSVVLGEPTRDTGIGAFTSQVGVFFPAWATDEVLSIGWGGELVVEFDHAVEDDANNPFGIDLLVFGNAFLTRSPATKAATSIFAEPGRLAVSQDGVEWVDVVAVSADTAFPTAGYADTRYTGSGNVGGTVATDFTKPVDPSFDPLGKTESQIQAGYAGSGGGTGIDLASTGLEWVRYVKVWQPLTDTWSTEIDAFADVAPLVGPVVPEPGTAALAVSAGLAMAWRGRRG